MRPPSKPAVVETPILVDRLSSHVELTRYFGYAAARANELEDFMPEFGRVGPRSLFGHAGVLWCKPESRHGTDPTSKYTVEGVNDGNELHDLREREFVDKFESDENGTKARGRRKSDSLSDRRSKATKESAAPERKLLVRLYRAHVNLRQSKLDLGSRLLKSMVDQPAKDWCHQNCGLRQRPDKKPGRNGPLSAEPGNPIETRVEGLQIARRKAFT